METYATALSFPVVRIFLCLVLSLELHVAHEDITTELRNGNLSEDVSVMSPCGIPGRKYVS